MKKNKNVNFFIVGAAKSGSTLVNDLLSQHPEISMLTKESHYFSYVNSGRPKFNGPKDSDFSNNVIVDIKNYNQLIEKTDDTNIIGESSVFNLFHKEAAKNIYDYNKEAKIIIIIRNPILRAYSAYTYMKETKKREQEISFELSLEKEEHRIKNNWEPIWYYQALGFYHQQIKNFYDVFPRNQILVFKYEDFITKKSIGLFNIENFLNVFNFLDYRDVHPKISGIINNRLVKLLVKTNIIKNLFKCLVPNLIWIRLQRKYFSKSKLKPTTYERLKLVFLDDIKKTEKLTGLDLTSYYL